MEIPIYQNWSSTRILDNLYILLILCRGVHHRNCPRCGKSDVANMALSAPSWIKRQKTFKETNIDELRLKGLPMEHPEKSLSSIETLETFARISRML